MRGVISSHRFYHTCRSTGSFTREMKQALQAMDDAVGGLGGDETDRSAAGVESPSVNLPPPPPPPPPPPSECVAMF